MRLLVQIRNAALAMLIAAPLTPSARAQATSDQGKPVDSQIRQMQLELEALRRDNQAMKGQIDELKARTEDNWLTEERAREIRGMVQDELADADSRASLMQNGANAGWSEHFFLGSADGRFLLIFEGQLQLRWIMNYHHFENRNLVFNTASNDLRDYRHGFEVTRARMTFRGHVFSPDLEYLIRADFFGARPQAAGFSNLLDAWVRYNLTDEWSFQMGQFKIPFNREELVSSAEQLAVERSLVNEAFNLGRSQGIQISYHDDDNALSGAYYDGATVNNASFIASPQVNGFWSTRGTDYAFATRYERKIAGTWEQFNDFTSPSGEEFGMLAGLAGHLQRGENTGLGSAGVHNEQTALGATADLSVEWGGANAFASFIYHYVDNAPGPVINFFGLVVQGGVYLAPKWELFGRYEHAWIDVDNPPDDLDVITGGVNYYIDGHDVKWTTDLGWALNPIAAFWVSDLAGYRNDFVSGFTGQIEAERPQVVFRTQVQILF